MDIMLAALMNGITSHTFDFDDTHLKTVIHPSGPVASALLALAERKPVSGDDFLHAFIVGVEVECRIGNAVYPDHYDVGWHITGTAGVFGAAAAAGRLLGLNEQQMVWALGIAATQSSGLREMFGTMCKPFHPWQCRAQRLARRAARSKDFTSSNQGIEAKRGFAHVLSTKFDGADHRRPGRKATRSAQHLQAVRLRHRHSPDHRRLRAAAQRAQAQGRRHRKRRGARAPAGGGAHRQEDTADGARREIQRLSLGAVAIIHGAAGEAEYSDAVVRDPSDRVAGPGIADRDSRCTKTRRTSRSSSRTAKCWKNSSSMRSAASSAR